MKLNFIIFQLLFLFLLSNCLSCKLSTNGIAKDNSILTFFNFDGSENYFKRTSEQLVKKEDFWQYSYALSNDKYSNIEVEYKFPIKQKCQGFISSDSRYYDMTRIDTKSFKVDDNQFVVHKFYYDRPNTYDEEMIFFLNEKTGIIFKKGVWGGITQLQSSSKLDSITIKDLKTQIQQDEEFYNSWKRH